MFRPYRPHLPGGPVSFIFSRVRSAFDRFSRAEIRFSSSDICFVRSLLPSTPIGPWMSPSPVYIFSKKPTIVPIKDMFRGAKLSFCGIWFAAKLTLHGAVLRHSSSGASFCFSSMVQFVSFPMFSQLTSDSDLVLSARSCTHYLFWSVRTRDWKKKEV